MMGMDPGGYRDAIAQNMMMQQRPRPFAPGIPTRRPGLAGGLAPMGGMSQPGGLSPGGGGQPGNPGTQAFDQSYNAAGGNYQPYQPPSSRGGGNLGMGGLFDPSMWNSGLPMGSLTGGY